MPLGRVSWGLTMLREKKLDDGADDDGDDNETGEKDNAVPLPSPTVPLVHALDELFYCSDLLDIILIYSLKVQCPLL